MRINIELPGGTFGRLEIPSKAFRQLAIINSIDSQKAKKGNNEITIFKFFTEDKRVHDSWRHVLVNVENEKFDLFDHSVTNHEFELSKFIDKPAISLGITKTVLLIIESPHRDEYTQDGRFIPKGPAQGKTGEKIRNYLGHLFSEYLSPYLDENRKQFYGVVICNPVQFQTSLYELHKKDLASEGGSGVRDKVWNCLFEVEKVNFLNRVNQYKPEIIINSCTAQLKEIVEEVIINYVTENKVLLFEADTHPCVWSSISYLFKK